MIIYIFSDGDPIYKEQFAPAIADVDDENCVGKGLLQIWTFGPKATLLPKGWSRSSGKTLKLEFVQHFAADVF